MIRTSAIRLATIATVVALIPAVAGCAAGVNAQTTQPFDTTDGANTVFHDISIRNVFVLGPDVNATLQPGQAAGLFIALVNNGGPDQLTAVSAPGTATSVTIRGGTVNLAKGQPALLTGPAPDLVLTGLTRRLDGGESVPVALTFQNAGTVVMIIPVVPRVNYYATFLPPAPSPTPTPTRSGRASKSPHPWPPGSARAAAATGTRRPSPVHSASPAHSATP